jgi:hypothetical protein
MKTAVSISTIIILSGIFSPAMYPNETYPYASGLHQNPGVAGTQPFDESGSPPSDKFFSGAGMHTSEVSTLQENDDWDRGLAIGEEAASIPVENGSAVLFLCILIFVSLRPLCLRIKQIMMR